MFSTLRAKILDFLGLRTEEADLIIPHGFPFFLQTARKSVQVISEACDETGTILHVSGSPKEIRKLKVLIGERK